MVICIKTAKYLLRNWRVVEAQISLTLLHINNLREIRLKNPNTLIFTHTNINSLRNKFEMFQEKIGNNVDVILISETKLNASFPSSQFIVDGFTPSSRLNRTQRGGFLHFQIRGLYCSG